MCAYGSHRQTQHEINSGELTHVLIGLAVDQAAGVSLARSGHPEEQGVGLDHVAVAGLKLIAGDQ